MTQDLTGRPLFQEKKIKLQYHFNVDETIDISKQMAELNNRLQDLEEAKKSAMSDFKSRIDIAKEELNMASRKIYSGFEMRDILCMVRYHCPRTGMKLIERSDTGEIWEERMSYDENNLFNQPLTPEDCVETLEPVETAEQAGVYNPSDYDGSREVAQPSPVETMKTTIFPYILVDKSEPVETNTTTVPWEFGKENRPAEFFPNDTEVNPSAVESIEKWRKMHNEQQQAKADELSREFSEGWIPKPSDPVDDKSQIQSGDKVAPMKEVDDLPFGNDVKEEDPIERRERLEQKIQEAGLTNDTQESTASISERLLQAANKAEDVPTPDSEPEAPMSILAQQYAEADKKKAGRKPKTPVDVINEHRQAAEEAKRGEIESF